MANVGLTGYPKEVDPQIGWPPALLVPKVEGHPKGLDTTNEAVELLKTAVGWWDCSSGFKSGDRWLRNRGTGGEALDLRLGSSTAPNSNDPLFLEPEELGYVYSPGGTNLAANTQCDAALNAGVDVDLRMLISPDTVLNPIYFQKSNAWWFENLDSGQLRIRVYWDGSTQTLYPSTGYIPASYYGRPFWVRCTVDMDNGASGHTVTYYTSLDGTTWDQLGLAIVTAGVKTGMYSVAGIVAVNPTAGKFYRAIIKNGIDGTTVLDIDCDRIKDGATESFPAVTGQTVQIFRAASGRKAVAMPAKRYGSRACMLFGTDDYMEIPSDRTEQHSLLNFGQGDSASALTINRLWSLGDQVGLLWKKATASAGSTLSGWNLWQSTTVIQTTLADGITLETKNTLGIIPGEITVLTSVINASNRLLSVYKNGIFGSSSIRSTVGTWNRATFQVGIAYSTNYMNSEFTAAAVFRRVLTQREIQLINDYYSKPLNANAYPVQAPDADRKTYLASKLAIDPAHPVLDVMKDAVFAIDAKAYDGASNYVENLGWGGELLNPRLGSSAAADSNDPKHLVPDSTGYAYLPGVAGNYLSVPHDLTLNVAGDLDVRGKVAADDWTPSAQGCIIGKWSSAGILSFEFNLGVTGGLLLRFSPDGTTIFTATSTASVPFTDGTIAWVRVVLDVDDGASNRVVTFYTSYDGISWTVLGDPVVQAGTTQVFASTSRIEVGSSVLNAGRMFVGRIYRAQYFDGIGGTTVLDVNCDAIKDGRQTSFNASTGHLVTVNRSTSGRKTVLMPNTTVKVMDEANIYLPGVNSNYLSVPHNAAFAISGDIDIRALVAVDNLATAEQGLVSRWTTSVANRSYILAILAGVPRLYWSTTGSDAANVTATAAVPTTSGTPIWVRVAMDFDNGAGGKTATFYTSTDGVNWTQLGNAVTTAGTSYIYSGGTSIMEVGSWSTGTLPFAGRVYRAQVYNGIAGTKVLDIDTSLAVAGQSTFTAVTGQTVTINSTANSGLRVNAQKVGAGHATWLLGTDDYMEVVGSLQHDLLNFKAGEEFTILAMIRQWGTESSETPWFAKYQGSAVYGWLVTGAPATTTAFYLGGPTLVGKSVTKPPYGSAVMTGARRLGDGTFSVVQTTAVDHTTLVSDSLVNTVATRIGALPSGGQYPAGELQSAMIFRRALTANEIATLTAFYESPGAAFNAAIPFNSPYVTFNG